MLLEKQGVNNSRIQGFSSLTREMTNARTKAIALVKNDYFCAHFKPIVLPMRLPLLMVLFFPWFLTAQPGCFYFLQKPDSGVVPANRVERYLALLDEKTPIEGSMYLDNEFAPANLILKNQQVLTNIFVRYNVFRDQMELIRDNDTAWITRPEEVRLLTIGRDQFRWLPFVGRDTLVQGYFEVVSEGFYRLLVRHVALFEPANPPYTALHIGNEYDRFLPMEFLYIQAGDEPAVKLKRSSAFLQKMFGDQWPAAREFIKTAGLRLRKRSDAEQLIRFCNARLDEGQSIPTALR